MVTEREKIDLILSILATGVYRPWFWANYKGEAKQRGYRALWVGHVNRFSTREIREGLMRWAVQFGIDTPPTPTEFAQFIRPILSDQGKRSLSQLRDCLATTTSSSECKRARSSD